MTALAPALIAMVTVIAGAFLTFLLNRKMGIESDWRKEKLTYYQEFIDALAVIVGVSKNQTDQREFSRASNNLLLVAPPEVLSAHHAYRDHIKVPNTERDLAQDRFLLTALLNSIRHDLKMPGLTPITEKEATLWSIGPSKPLLNND